MNYKNIKRNYENIEKYHVRFGDKRIYYALIDEDSETGDTIIPINGCLYNEIEWLTEGFVELETDPFIKETLRIQDCKIRFSVNDLDFLTYNYFNKIEIVVKDLGEYINISTYSIDNERLCRGKNFTILFSLFDIHRGLDHIRMTPKILNNLHVVKALSQYDFITTEEVEEKRENWDTYFMNIAEAASTRSTCIRRKVGAVLVKNNAIISTGYNGAPKGLTHCIDNEEICLRNKFNIESGKQLDICRAVHAEQNTIIQANNLGVNTEGATIYVNTFPCLTCAKMLINAGIKRVVYSNVYSDKLSKLILEEADIECVQI